MFGEQVKKRIWLLALTMLVLALVTPACGAIASPTREPTDTPTPTNTPRPTDVVTAIPTRTPTRRPTDAPAPSPTPVRSLSGRVTDAVTGQGIGGAKVEVRRTDGEWCDGSTTTASDGSYAIFGLPTGDYVVRVIAPGYAREYYDNVTPSHAANVVRVTAPHETPGIDFDLTEGGAISGYVYNGQTDDPIEGARVAAVPSGELFVDDGFHTATAADGSYLVENLALGEYVVCVEVEGWVTECYDSHYHRNWATTIVVAPPGTAVGIDFGLIRGGAVSGFVYESDGVTPIREAEIWANVCPPDLYCIDFFGHTQADGRYLISGIVPWGGCTVRASKDGYAPEYYDSQDDMDGADAVAVAAGDTVTGIDFALESGGTVTGHVYEEDGVTPISGILVSAYSPTGGRVKGSGTDYDGRYRIWLGTGEYILTAEAGVRGHKWVDEWHDNRYRMEDADPVRVAAPDTTSGVDFYLAEAGSISGHVYEEDGVTPIAGASVYAFPVTGDHPGAGANTGPEGSYTIQGLPSGVYRVQATVSGHVAEYYDDSPDVASATGVRVDAHGDTPGVDFALRRVPE